MNNEKVIQTEKIERNKTGTTITNKETLDAIEEVHHMLNNNAPGYYNIDELFAAMFEDEIV